MKFVGHLFLQGLMAEASMGHLAHQLLDNAERMERNKQQRDHQVELACELLATVGEALEQSSSGQTILTELWSRLADWKCAVDTAGAWLLGTRTSGTISKGQRISRGSEISSRAEPELSKEDELLSKS